MFARLHIGIWLKWKANCFCFWYFTLCAFVSLYLFPLSFCHLFLVRHFQLYFPLSFVCFFPLCLLLLQFPLSLWKLSGLSFFFFFFFLSSLLSSGLFCEGQWSALGYFSRSILSDQRGLLPGVLCNGKHRSFSALYIQPSCCSWGFQIKQKVSCFDSLPCFVKSKVLPQTWCNLFVYYTGVNDQSM